MEGWAGRDSAVEPSVEALGADLAANVDAEGLRDRDHALLRGDQGRIADVVNRVKREAWVVVDEVIEPPRSHRPARDNRPADHAGLDEVDHGLGDHVGVNRELFCSSGGGASGLAPVRARSAAWSDRRSDARRTWRSPRPSARTKRSIRSAGIRLSPASAGMLGLISATTVRAASAPAWVTSTQMPRLRVPSASGGATCTSATSSGIRSLRNSSGTSGSESGR
jgi:hypothetical protein